MTKCRKCGTELNENDKFCIYCGAKQEKNNEEEDTFEYDEVHNTSPQKRFKLNRQNLKIFGITILTIGVFAISLKLISLIVKK